MPRRRSEMRRTPGDWAIRIVLALVVFTGGVFVILQSLALVVRRSDPERSYALAPWDGRTAAALSERLSGPDASAADHKRAAALALSALRQDPTTVQAAATLGLDAASRGDLIGTRRWFSYSQQLSRRDLRTQIWAIEEAVGKGNVGDALRHYDIALRTSRAAADVLFPVLSSALADVGVRSAAASLLATHPIWGDQFIAYAADHGDDPLSIAQLFHQLSARHALNIDDQARVDLVQRLIQAGHVNAAWNYYASFRRGAKREDVRNPQFRETISPSAPFDWTTASDSGISAVIGGGALEFNAPASAGGLIVRQLQVLPMGKYRLQGSDAEIDQPDDGLPYWQVTCLDGRVLGRILVTNSSRSAGRFSGNFAVPALCPVQQIVFMASPTSKVEGLSGKITQISIQAQSIGSR